MSPKIALIVSKYLEGTELSDNDSYNTAGFNVEHMESNFGWNIANKAKPTLAQLQALQSTVESAAAAEANKQAKILAGKVAREICEQVLDLVAGYNLDRQLTLQQITQMQSTFANAEAALRAGRPTYAKAFISAIVVDEVLVTQEMKDMCLELLANY